MRRILTISLVLLLLPMMALGQIATILESTTEYEYLAGKGGVCRQHRVVRVNNEHGVGAATFRCYCSDDLHLSKFSGQVVDANGKELTKVKQKDLVRSEFSKELVTDQYFYIYGYEGHNFPYTVTYDWEMRIDGTSRFFPVFAPQPGYEVDVASATYRIIYDQDNTFRYRAFNFTPDIKQTVEKGQKVMEVALHDLPAIPHYSHSLPLDSIMPLMYFAPKQFDMQRTHCDMTSWQTFGTWVYQLREGRDQIPEVLSARLHELTDTCQTDRSRVETVRRFMGDNTRYVSIQGGINGYRPMPVEEVYRKGIGDCKALANYLCAMLRHIGIKAEYALISTEDRRLLDIPNMQQLNHVIAQVPLPGDTLWVECTNATFPYDHLPVDLADHDVLLITPEGGRLARTPAMPDECHVDNTHYDVQLSANGHADIHKHEQLKGHFYDKYLGLTKQGATEQRKALLADWGLPKATFSDLKLWNDAKVLTIDAQLTSESYAKRTGGRLFVPLCPEQIGNLRNSNEPAHDISLTDAGFVSVDTILITLPEGARLEHLPEPVQIETPFGAYSLTASILPAGQVQVITHFSIRGSVYRAEQYTAWVDFRKAVATQSAIKMVVVM